MEKSSSMQLDNKIENSLLISGVTKALTKTSRYWAERNQGKYGGAPTVNTSNDGRKRLLAYPLLGSRVIPELVLLCNHVDIEAKTRK